MEDGFQKFFAILDYLSSILGLQSGQLSTASGGVK
jgi:hypothetical protein